MEMNYAFVNIDNMLDNIKNFKNNYSYEHYILNVSNNAFCHGIEIVKYLNEEFDYLYTINFNDVINIRKYNHQIKIIYNGIINEDNIYDLILNNAILVIKSKVLIDFILNLKIKDKLNIIFSIDINGFNGFDSKNELSGILENIKKDVHINVLGVSANIVEENYQDFKDIIDIFNSLELIILNNENDKNKIKMSNAIILDKSIYGIDVAKKKLFSKEISSLKPILEIISYIDKVKIMLKGKKESYIGVMPFGLVHGFSKSINKVYINGNFYNIREIKDEYTLIDIDSSIKENAKIEIIGSNNRLDFYVKDEVFNAIYSFSNTLCVIYKNKLTLFN